MGRVGGTSLGMINSWVSRVAAGFSQGERMKLALARVLVHDPPNILLDEPADGLDVNSVRSLRTLLLHLRAEGKCDLIRRARKS